MLSNRHWVRAGLHLASMLVMLLGFWRAADADTIVSPRRIESNTTWTLAGSPYIVDRYVWVYPNVTLTIEPGVVVKVSHPYGSIGEIYVEGNLVAIGTAESRITFTSIQDDSIGGDSGGDGLTVGAPGQWYSMWTSSTGTLTLKWVDVSYGGWGSSDTSYGAIMPYNGGSAVLDHVRARNNQRSGLLVWGLSTADVAHSEFSQNAVGVSISGGTALIHSNSSLSNNGTGLYVLLPPSFTGAATSVLNSEISNNTGHGVWLLIYGGTPSVPSGRYNNIRDNGGPDGDQRQLHSMYPLVESEWKDNYWGDVKIEIPCPWALPTTAQNHLSFDPPNPLGYCAEPGKGPVRSSIWLMGTSCPNQKPLQCASDYVTNSPYATDPFDNSGL
jgi:hypothetical protein